MPDSDIPDRDNLCEQALFREAMLSFHEEIHCFGDTHLDKGLMHVIDESEPILTCRRTSEALLEAGNHFRILLSFPSFPLNIRS